jgi:hypothetical protein
MKAALVLSLMILVPTGHAASAAQADALNYADIDVVSVAPRSAAVKPYVLAIFTKEQQQRLATAAIRKSGPQAKDLALARQ